MPLKLHAQLEGRHFLSYLFDVPHSAFDVVDMRLHLSETSCHDLLSGFLRHIGQMTVFAFVSDGSFADVVGKRD
jgi:hypothetical protein